MSRRESESEDEKMKALAAVLSDDDSRRYQYTRDQLLSIRQSALSCVRPEYLSVEFDNEDGKFMPEKWLEYRWMCEGVENRPSAGARRKEKLKAEALESADSTVLSPQRRAFSSGCRAASPSKNEGEPERLGVNKGNWRSGAGFMLKNSTSTDFKPAFGRRNASSGEEKMPEWLNEGPTSMLDMIELKGFDDEQHGKSKRVQSARSKRETVASKQLQQAMSSSCQRSARNNTSAHQQQPSHSSTVTSSSSATSSASSRTTSSSITAPSANNITPSQTPPIATSGDKTDKDNDYEKASDKGSALKHSTLAQQNEHCSSTSGTNQTVRIPPELAASMSPILNGKLPNSDAEFAAIFGLLGENDLNSIKQKDTNSSALQPPSVTGSRLSRFFATPLSNDQPNANAESDGTSSTGGGTSRITPPNANVPSPLQSSSSSTTTANPILQKLFNSSPQQTAQAPRSAIPLQHMMRVEDLERGFQQEAAANSATAPNSSSNAPFQKEFISDDGSEHLRALGLDTVPSSNYLNKHAMKDASYQHQMHLMNNNNNANSILSRLSSTQASASAVRAPLPQSNLASQHQYMSYPTSTTSLSTPSPNLLPPPNNSDQTVTALQAAAFMRQQYEAAAILQQIHALQQQQQQLTGGASGAQFGGDFNAVRFVLF
ncbi:unnamed protein product [Anisakis simplex]|uniref:BZIP domain-containing protein n=1 Tax=Anisakis simplex TaxID=6269 RepID=A0A0M3K2P6_ANISI|nr:unnamed protein product [Anisakis simplex]